jgi:HPt (histidine-containing phosphotransfer) domain-containing protein
MNEKNLSVLNPDILEALIGDDKELTDQFRIDFLKQAKVSLEKIYHHFNNENFKEIKEEAHYLKTSAKAIGAEITGDQLQMLEQYAENEQSAQCRLMIVELGKSIKAVYEAIKHGQ